MIDLNACGHDVVDLRACCECFRCVWVDFNACGRNVNVCGHVVIDLNACGHAVIDLTVWVCPDTCGCVLIDHD